VNTLSREFPLTSKEEELARQHRDEVARGARFEFGRNWRSFLDSLDEERILRAEQSLCEMLEVDSLDGRSFLDIGSGSGLFSLAARRLGARVHSFDFDADSVACTRILRDRYCADDPLWTVERGSVLQREYVESLGTFDVVYSWGVLHQTGDMWEALDIVSQAVKDQGRLFISIYNDQGGGSRRWWRIKWLYNHLPRALRWLLVLAVGVFWELRSMLIRIVRFQNPLPFGDWREKKRTRGMSVWHDLVDWVGGFPFEVAKPEQLVDFFRQRDFTLLRMTTMGKGHGCNEFVFVRRRPSVAWPRCGHAIGV
jgi:2-polyprenyl-6-hydroxyphenyl methylase/3-demethylubiquinone-9 3-methyltransferase